MKICKDCGYPIPDEYANCPNCIKQGMKKLGDKLVIAKLDKIFNKEEN